MEIQLPKALAELMARPGLTDLTLNGHTHTYLDVGDGLQRTTNPFASERELFEFLIDLGFQTGSRIDMSKPISDFMVQGFRFHAVLGQGVCPKAAGLNKKAPARGDSIGPPGRGGDALPSSARVSR